MFPTFLCNRQTKKIRPTTQRFSKGSSRPHLWWGGGRKRTTYTSYQLEQENLLSKQDLTSWTRRPADVFFTDDDQTTVNNRQSAPNQMYWNTGDLRGRSEVVTQVGAPPHQDRDTQPDRVLHCIFHVAWILRVHVHPLSVHEEEEGDSWSWLLSGRLWGRGANTVGRNRDDNVRTAGEASRKIRRGLEQLSASPL